MPGVQEFMNKDENKKCRDILKLDTNKLCENASAQGVNCATSGLVGTAGMVCDNNPSKKLKKAIDDMYDCQKRLFQNVVMETMNTLGDGQEELFEILQDVTKSFNLEVAIASTRLETEVRVLEIINVFIALSAIAVVIFLLFVRNFK